MKNLLSARFRAEFRFARLDPSTGASDFPPIQRTRTELSVDVIQLIPTHATIRPWTDPVVDAKGHDPRSAYVERFWLSVIGPTTNAL